MDSMLCSCATCQTFDLLHKEGRLHRPTSLIALDSMISLKYWLDEPFWTMMSCLDLLPASLCSPAIF